MKRQFKILHELFYPTNQAIIRRLQAGENIPMRQRGMRQAVVGEIVSDLPPGDIQSLLAKGYIEEVADVSTRQ